MLLFFIVPLFHYSFLTPLSFFLLSFSFCTSTNKLKIQQQHSKFWNGREKKIHENNLNLTKKINSWNICSCHKFSVDVSCVSFNKWVLRLFLVAFVSWAQQLKDQLIIISIDYSNKRWKDSRMRKLKVMFTSTSVLICVCWQ